MQGFGKEIIAYEHGYLIAKQGIDAGLSAPLAAIVDYIIVDQTGRMQEFERDGRAQGFLANGRESLGREEY